MLEINECIHGVPVALSAAYKFTDRAFVWLQSSERPGVYLVFLKPKSDGTDLRALSGAFANELIDQGLRMRLNEQCGPLRTLIAAQAFSEANLLDSIVESEQSGTP